MFTFLLSAALVVTSVGDLRTKSRENRIGTGFDLVARVLSSYTETDQSWTVEDDSGAVGLGGHPQGVPPPPDGAVVRVRGVLRGDGFNNEYAVAVCQSLSVLATGTPPVPRKITGTDLIAKSCDKRLVSIRGIVRDIYRDDIDPRWYYIILDCDGFLVNVTIPSREGTLDRMLALTDARIEATGICSLTSNSKRRQTGPMVAVKTLSSIVTLSPPPEDPFSAPEIHPSYELGPMDLLRFGRRSVRGSVIAIWQGRHRALVRTASGRLCGIEFSTRSTYAFGDVIDAVGFVETDLYRINLSRAVGRKIGSTNVLEDVQCVSTSDIFNGHGGPPRINPDFHGKAIELTGLVKSRFGTGDASLGFVLEENAQTISVDCSAHPDLAAEASPGCLVRVSGTCILNTDNWQPHAAFPKIRDMTLVPRQPSDVTILSRPSWWTSGRLLVVIGTLLVALAAILVWNRLLNRIVERRSRQLLRERSERDIADLKNEERLRLAVELHDTISQNLTGIALQVDAAQLAAESEPESVPSFLETIRLRLLHCRSDLRNCLWDLRSRAFEERCLADAIRMTLAPHLNGTVLDLDADIPTRELSDNVTHSILCMIRELTVNAIRHGRATRIRIVCRMRGDRLDLSVTDNGGGFSPDRRPDFSRGHFGIQGVIERVERLEGSHAIESKPGCGTTFTIRNLKIIP